MGAANTLADPSLAGVGKAGTRLEGLFHKGFVFGGESFLHVMEGMKAGPELTAKAGTRKWGRGRGRSSAPRSFFPFAARVSLAAHFLHWACGHF